MKAYNNTNAYLLKIKNTQENTALQMITAENDYRENKNVNNTNIEYEQDCIEFHNNIKIAAKTINDDFLRIKDYTGNELILYIYENSIYVPHCEENYNVFIYHLDDCFEYIPIRWLVDRESNFRGTGYLTNEKIIVSESVRIQCKDKPNIAIEIENNTRLIP